MKLLLIEDEASLRAALQPLLVEAGYLLQMESDGLAGLQKAVSARFDLILLDVMLPGLDGFSICREIRKRGHAVPVLMLTARGMVEDRVRGLDEGADDYLVKPFSGQELLARIRALLRRSLPETKAPETLKIGNLRVDFRKLSCLRDDTELSLSTREFRVLEILTAANGKPVTRDEFLDKAWGYQAFPTNRTVDNLILGLRQKIEENPTKPRILLTVHGIGYRLGNL